MRILAIDYGKKRCGIAVTDPLQIISTNLKTVSTEHLLEFLMDYTKNEPVEIIVIGKPYKLDNSLNDIYSEIEKLKKKIKELLNITIHEIDERYTSKLAQKTIIDSGISKKKRRDKSLVDMISATIILQNYMELKSNNKI